jgi:hypothetical protein
MSLTYADARDAIFRRVYESLTDGRVETLIGEAPQIQFQSKEKATKPDLTKYFFRISIQSVRTKQASLSSCVLVQGKRRYTSYGLVHIQVFAPKPKQNSIEIANQVAMILQNALRKPTGNRVFFYNAAIKELPSEEDSYRLNVVADYEYDEIG